MSHRTPATEDPAIIPLSAAYEHVVNVQMLIGQLMSRTAAFHVTLVADMSGRSPSVTKSMAFKKRSSPPSALASWIVSRLTSNLPMS